MISLGLKIGVVAFVACVTFIVLCILLVTVIGAVTANTRTKKKTSSKVTKMPRRNDSEE